jgi:hypothetical protein
LVNLNEQTYLLTGYGSADAIQITTQLQCEIDSHKSQAEEFKEKLRKAGVCYCTCLSHLASVESGFKRNIRCTSTVCAAT